MLIIHHLYDFNINLHRFTLMLASAKKPRKRLRAQRKGWEDKNKIEKSYEPGNFETW